MTIGIWWNDEKIGGGYQPIRLDRFERKMFDSPHFAVKFLIKYSYWIHSIEVGPVR